MHPLPPRDAHRSSDRGQRTCFAAASAPKGLGEAKAEAGASAEIVCSGNTCWHVKERYEYPPAAGVVIHEDTWGPAPGITFREHEGRGFWKGDVWTAW